MPDPKGTATVDALDAAIATMARAPSFYGGGPPFGLPIETMALRYAFDYLAHHPNERTPLSDGLRAIFLSGNKPSRPTTNHAPLLRDLYTLGSLPHAAEFKPGHLVYGQWDQQYDFDLLETYRSDVASLARFSQRVDHATFYLCVAVDTSADSLRIKGGVSMRRRAKSWLGDIAHHCFARWHSTRALLIHDLPLQEKFEPLYRTAFWNLCELTPADNQLKQLYELDRFKASHELVRHVDAHAKQLVLATELSQKLRREGEEADPSSARREAIQQALLDKAGDQLTLSEAAERLGISRQAMHKKIKSGAILGLMVGQTFVVPGIQLVKTKTGVAVIPHLRKVLSLFVDAGNWSALQYLVEPDPALGGALPIERLAAGDSPTVIAAATAYLGLDEG
jgi:DNA-directed RNA polymerase specialized sigma24 family protein